MTKPRVFIANALLLVLLIMLSTTHQLNANELLPADSGTLYIGNIAKNPRHNSEERMALLQGLKHYLSRYDFNDVKLRFTSSMPEMVGLMTDKKVHIVVDSLYPAVRAAKQSGFNVVAEKHHPAKEQERFVIFTRHDSGVNRLEQLLGHSLAVEDNHSTSTYALPRLHLQSLGLTTTNQRPSAGEIGFDFYGEEINVSRAAVLGDNLAGVLRKKEWLNPKKMPVAFRRHLKIIYTSEPFTGRVIAVSDDIAPLFSAERLKPHHSADFPYVPVHAGTKALIDKMEKAL